MSAVVRLAALLATLAAPPTLAGDGPPHRPSAAPRSEAARAARCDHGVQRSLCTRCNPKLAPVYKAKGDWCPEHERPESQCVLCHPELAKKGVK